MAKEKFTPPTIEEIAEYCKQRKNGIDAEAFWAHYEARGWIYKGNIKMVSWKAAVITWEKYNKTRRSATVVASSTKTLFDPSSYFGEIQ
jgi:hypothetical protein